MTEKILDEHGRRITALEGDAKRTEKQVREHHVLLLGDPENKDDLGMKGDTKRTRIVVERWEKIGWGIIIVVLTDVVLRILGT